VPQITLKKTWLAAAIPTDWVTHTTTLLRTAATLLNMKRMLVSAGWSVVQSSNGTVLGTGAGDYWLSVSDVIYGIAGTPHSWVVLQNAAFMPGFSVILDRGPTTSQVDSINARFGACAQGYAMNGTRMLSPTANGVEAVRDNVNFVDVVLDCTGTTLLYSSDSQCFRFFNTHCGSCGDDFGFFSSYGGAVITLERPANVHAVWTDPFVLAAFAAVSGVMSGGGGWTYNPAQSYRGCVAVVESRMINLLMSSMMGDTRWVGWTPMASGVSANGASLLYPIFYEGYTNGVVGVLGRAVDLYSAPCTHAACFRYATVGNPVGLIRMGCMATGAPNGIVKVC
jgi:hypothetical protein